MNPAGSECHVTGTQKGFIECKCGTATYFATQIEHRNAAGLAMLRMDYTYTVNDLPYTIQEWDQFPLGQWSWRATTTFAYDRLRRLTHEVRSGANGAQTVVQLDPANRVQSVERRASALPGATLLMRADYTYWPNGRVDRITYDSDAVVQYFYEAHRLSSIVHLAAPWIGGELIRLDYEYTANDLPWRIMEYPPGIPGQPAMATTTFTYDRRNRLTRETRVGGDGYDVEYQYDAGGNRTVKIDHDHDLRVEYHYDVEAGADPNVYGSLNNRLMWYETIDTTDPSWPLTVSKTYYVYTYDATYGTNRVNKTDGNPTRIITEVPSGVIMESMATSPGDPNLGGEGVAAAAAAPPPGGPQYSAVRLGYAHNGQAVTFAHGETWTGSSGCPSDYQIPWAREFRYDGARARYMNRKLDPAGLLLDPPVYTALSTTWSDYDGNEAYGDYTVTPGSPPTVTSTDLYQPGLWRRVNSLARYQHGDHLGSLRLTSTGAGTGGAIRTYTAFGERISATSDRFGYVGAYGYQSTLDGGVEVFPFLHVGARYYDPSSGRFLQRDPIGVAGGMNVYAYVGNNPALGVDPEGLINDNGFQGYIRPWPSISQIAQEVRDEAGDKGDDWAHYCASCRIATEVPLGPIIALPIGLGKEVGDNLDFGPGRPPVGDTFMDLWADLLGTLRGLKQLFGSGMTCSEAADARYGY